MASAPSETETHAGTEAEHGGGGGGLPQLEMEYWGGQIVWLLLIFGLLYILISRVFAPRLRGVLDLRAKTISDAVAAARAVQAEADAQAEAARSEVAEARAAARSTAAAAKAGVTADIARRQAEEEARVGARLAEAEAAIAQTRDAAMGQVAKIAEDTTQAILTKLTGQPAPAVEVSAALSGLNRRS